MSTLSDVDTGVVVVLTWRGRVGLFRGGAAGSADGGRWSCLRAHLRPGEDILVGAARALLDGTGLVVRDLVELSPGPTVQVTDEGGQSRAVRTVLARTDRRRLSVDAAQLRHRWVRPDHLPRFDGQVAWLSGVVAAFGGPRAR